MYKEAYKEKRIAGKYLLGLSDKTCTSGPMKMYEEAAKIYKYFHLENLTVDIRIMYLEQKNCQDALRYVCFNFFYENRIMYIHLNTGTICPPSPLPPPSSAKTAAIIIPPPHQLTGVPAFPGAASGGGGAIGGWVPVMTEHQESIQIRINLKNE